MSNSRRMQEMEFELALLGVLEDLYELNIRVEGDPLNRRKNGYATLRFDYHYPNGNQGDVKVDVSIEGVANATFSFAADFDDSASVYRAADDCEELALAIREYLGDGPELDLFDQEFQRRWDD